MKKVLVVIRTEIINIFTRRSYLILTFGLPILGFILFMAFSSIQKSDPNLFSNILEETSTLVNTEGYVDPGNVIQVIPPDLFGDIFIKYEDETSAKQALAQGLISGYYIFEEDIFQTGEILYIQEDFNPLSDNSRYNLMEELLTLNLFDGNRNLSSLAQYPVNFMQMPLDPSAVTNNEDSSLTFLVPYVTTIMFYIVILSSASLLLNSVVGEKQNRVLEVIMLSVSPQQLLTGKIIGLGFVGLMQSLIYTGVGFTLLKISGGSIAIPPQLDFSPSILI